MKLRFFIADKLEFLVKKKDSEKFSRSQNLKFSNSLKFWI